MGQLAAVAGIAAGAALPVVPLVRAWFPAIPAGAGFADPATQWTTLLIFAVILALHASLNIFGVRLVALLNDVSVWWHIAGVPLIVVGVVGATLLALQFNPGNAGVCCATQVTGPAVHGLNSAGTLFAVNQTFNATGFPLWYAFLIGLLLAQY